jgi:hypothetical protein
MTRILKYFFPWWYEDWDKIAKEQTKKLNKLFHDTQRSSRTPRKIH